MIIRSPVNGGSQSISNGLISRAPKETTFTGTAARYDFTTYVGIFVWLCTSSCIFERAIARP